MRGIARVLEDAGDGLIRAKQRPSKVFLRYGHVFDEVNGKGQHKGNRTRARWERTRRIEFSEVADQEAFAYCISGVRRFEAHKKRDREVHTRACEKGSLARASGGAEMLRGHRGHDGFRRGGITEAGNSHLRKLLIEASWHYVGAHPSRKRNERGEAVSLRVENHAAKGVRRLIGRRKVLHARGKKPVVANCATARGLACWIWAIGRMCEDAL